MRGFRKEKNMRANPKVTLLAYDPKHPLRNIEIRGTVVDMTEEGALEHLDHLTQLYLHKPGVIPIRALKRNIEMRKTHH
jgi:hypothetical protein